MTVAGRRPAGRAGAAALVAVIVIAVALVAWRVGAWQDDDSGSGAPAARATSAPPRVNEVTDGDGSEVIRQPDGSAASGLPHLPAAGSASRGPLITASAVPRTASRLGALVTGFPTSVIPVLPDAAVASSGVSSSQDVVQLSLVANSSRSPDAVRAFYRRALTGLGFVESVVPASGGSVGAGFTRGADHLVVTTGTHARTTRFSVFGTVHAGTHG